LEEQLLTIKEQEKVILVGVFGPDISREEAKEHLNELERLADTAGGVAVKKILQNRTHPDPDTYIGKGKIQEIKADSSMLGADTIIFDDDLTPAQIRNIQKGTDSKIIDRSGLILDIFASRAQTSAAKTQVELAQLQYLLPRLTRAWTHLSRQKGGIGTKGPGETQIETDRRMIGKRIATLKEKLDKLDQQRALQRKQRTGLTRVSLVGYTNAGKSSLLNTLTETEKLAEDRLFATLDSTVRQYQLNSDKKVLLSDTVGFIRKLPHNLIESFKSTLDEISESDIILHLVDASAVTVEDYISVVQNTLREIGADEKPRFLVFNKIDAADGDTLSHLKRNYPEALFISATQQIGLDAISKKIVEIIERDYTYEQRQLPVDRYELVSFEYDNAVVEHIKHNPEHVDIGFKMHKNDVEKLDKMLAVQDNETN
jgi:GTP-binding protein HflX